jgi:hypothetical protein
MDYALAKQLKDAGFPQKEDGTQLFAYGVNLGMSQKQMTAKSAYRPTLEELIEACGDKFEVLNRDDDGWYCNNIVLPEHAHEPFYSGSTPIEAVARLWLALNTK